MHDRMSMIALVASLLVMAGTALGQPSPDVGMMDESMMDLTPSVGYQQGHMMMAAPVVSRAMMGCDPMIGHPMMGHPMMGMGLQRLLNIPDLSDDQRATLTVHHRSLQRELWRLQGKAMDARFALEDASGVDVPDPKAVGRAMQGLFDVRRQMVEASIAARNDARKVLSDEQVKALDDGVRAMGTHGMHGVHRSMMRQ